jgi:hypothetical protein
MHGVEVLVVNVPDPRIRQREPVNDHAHGLAQPRVVGTLVKDGRLQNEGFTCVSRDRRPLISPRQASPVRS